MDEFIDDLTDNMSLLAVIKKRDRRLKDTKRRAVGLEKGDRIAVATKVVVEEFPELTSQILLECVGSG
jgi:hypothetical protein